ncbi:helicase HerA-like domain-containing protein [Saccharopolyspora sp. NPDC050642]|uniref:helicase HerA-like domain-containing protein n=1 Tax=Saccharopolyspora sp. NPDC050642 TaxID=3157099 RepID=UPI0033DABC6F
MAGNAAQEIASGYATEGAAVELGAVVVDGSVDAAAAVRIPLATMNRHGLVAGATGTGKTKTLQLLAEQLSDAGVPVLLADVKGDLSGLSAPGEGGGKVAARAAEVGDDWRPAAFPVQFLSLGTDGRGVPIRATVTGFGPLLLAKVLGLNATQESTLGLIFHWADERGLALLDIKDLRSVIQYLTSDEGKAELKGIGGASAASAGVILRALSNLEARGGDEFFGEPELAVADLLRHGKYEQTVDRESAYELLAKKIAAAPEMLEKPEVPEKSEASGFLEKAMGNPAVRSFFRSAASALGREITRGLFGNRRR